jgi:hypothetical protein
MPLIEKHEIVLQVSGPEFEKHWPMRDITRIFTHLQILLDSSFSTIYHIPRHQVQKHLLVNIREVERGSFRTSLELIMATVQISMTTVLLQSGPKEAWQLMKDAYMYLKASFTLADEGKIPEVTVDPSAPGVVLNGNRITVSGGIHYHAHSCENTYKKLTKMVDGRSIDRISLLDTDEPSEPISIGAAERELFNPKVRIAKDPVEATAKIYAFNVYDSAGRLEVIESDHVPNKTYHFVAQDKNSIEQYVHALLDEPVKVFALKEVEVRPNGVERVVKLIVYRVEKMGQV